MDNRTEDNHLLRACGTLALEHILSGADELFSGLDLFMDWVA